jgi:hypothetical protein
MPLELLSQVHLSLDGLVLNSLGVKNFKWHSSQVARDGVLPLYFKIANRRSCILQDYRIAQVNRMLKGDGRRRKRNATILRACFVQYRQYVHRVRPSPDGGKSAAA